EVRARVAHLPAGRTADARPSALRPRRCPRPPEFLRGLPGPPRPASTEGGDHPSRVRPGGSDRGLTRGPRGVRPRPRRPPRLPARRRDPARPRRTSPGREDPRREPHPADVLRTARPRAGTGPRGPAPWPRRWVRGGTPHIP